MTVRTLIPGDEVAVDYETVGLRTQDGARAFTVNFTWVKDGHSETVDAAPARVAFIRRLREVWENDKVVKIAHNLKFEYHHTLALGITPRVELHDTMVMHQMLNNLAPRHSLDHVARRFAGHVEEWDECDSEVAKAARIYGTYDKIPRDLMHKYQRADGERCALIYGAMAPLLRANPKVWADYQNEIELIKVTVRMENNGIMLDKGNSLGLIDWMLGELQDVEHQTLQLVGEQVNLSSPKQLAKLLYEKYHLPVPSWSDAGEPQTGKDALEKLRLTHDHPIIDLILKNRAYKKGIAMIRSYIEHSKEGDILYPNINTNKAGTGRQSSSDPINFQNIQKEFSLRTRFAVPARKCFRARPGSVWYCIDYQGIEMRLGVQGTGSERLIKMVGENFDFHAACAASFYGDRFIKETDKTKRGMLRGAAKNTRFLMFYGGGIEAAAKTLGLSLEETKDGYERDKEEYPEFYAFMDRCTRLARKNGYIETFFGRRLQVYHDKPYTATDYCIQGSAAGVLKRAEVALDKYFTEELDGQVKMLLPVHDELIIEFPRRLFLQRNEILGNIRQLMINIEYITVPLEVEVKYTSTTWDKAKELKE
jgi:DNA polymerase-1